MWLINLEASPKCRPMIGMRSILVTGGTVITMDARRRLIPNGAVYIEDGVVADVGRAAALKKSRGPDVEIRATDHAILPGFVDSHVHMTHSLIRGLCHGLTLKDCLTGIIWPAQAAIGGDEALAASELCMLEMLTSGTTTFVEAGLHTRFGLDRIAESVQRIGLRGVLSKTIMDSPASSTNVGALDPAMVEDAEECFRETSSLLKKWSAPGSRVGIWLASRALGAVSRELFREVACFSKEKGTGITMHLMESEADVGFTKKFYGATPVQFAKEAGLLGPRTLLAHMLGSDERDAAALSASGTSVAHCPSSSMTLASGYCPVPMLLRAGVKVSLGCDGASHNFSYDMFNEMRLASILHKARQLDPTALPAASVLELATTGGAEAVGLRCTGSIEVGKAADIITVDLKRSHTTPAPDAASALVYSSTGSDVDNVIVGGSLLLEGGRVLTCDVGRVLRAGSDAAARVLERSGLRRA